MKDIAYQTWTSSRVVELELKLLAAITLLLLCRFGGNPIEFVLSASSWAFGPWRGHVKETPVLINAGVEAFEVAANRGS